MLRGDSLASSRATRFRVVKNILSSSVDYIPFIISFLSWKKRKQTKERKSNGTFKSLWMKDIIQTHKKWRKAILKKYQLAGKDVRCFKNMSYKNLIIWIQGDGKTKSNHWMRFGLDNVLIYRFLTSPASTTSASKFSESSTSLKRMSSWISFSSNSTSWPLICSPASGH